MKGFLKSIHYALRGFRFGWQERNFRLHLLALAGVIPGGLLLGLSSLEWLSVALCSGMVMAAELGNTALEKLTDLVHPEQHPGAGKIKDLGAAAVLVSAFTALVVALILLYRHL